MQPSHIGPSSFLGFLEYPPDGHPGNVGLGGMHPTSSLASGGFKIVIVSRTFLIC